MAGEVRETGEQEASPVPAHRSGSAAIAGRTNVGKSTLLNALVGEKLAIVTARPQTTRRCVLGVKNLPGAQVLFFDTPGIHHARELINRRMVARAVATVNQADVNLWVVDCSVPLTREDLDVADLVRSVQRPRIVVLNKMDRVGRPQLLPRMKEVAEILPEAPIVPVSARTGENLEVLLRTVVDSLPEGPRSYPEEEVTDQTERDLVAEIVREKVILETEEEVPYQVAVKVDSLTRREGKNVFVIRATIYVNRPSQKPILLGRGGTRLKAIGTAARRELEEFLGGRVFLELFVRVQPGWTKEPGFLQEFGL